MCSKVGNLAYLPVYLFFGLAAAITHLIFDGDPAVGASGAINGVVGMFLVLFPLNDINCLWWVSIYVRTFSISSYWLILFWLFWDVVGAYVGGESVAYYAHLGGFAAGAGLGVLLCVLRVIKMSDDERSLVQIWQQWRQDRLEDRLAAEAMRAVEEAKKNAPPETAPIKLHHECIRFACPCGQQFRVAAKMAGKQGKCPQCRNAITVPHL